MSGFVRPLQALLVPVLAAAPSLVAQADDFDGRVRAALERARPALLQHLERAGDGMTNPGLLALLCLAALHDGIPPADAALAPYLRKLVDANCQQTYELSLRLLVLEQWPDYPERQKLAERDAKAIQKHRLDGAFSYADDPSDWDLSNTQYGALGMRAAASIGVAIERRAWQQLADAVADMQDSYGGFGYRPRQEGRKEAYASMTAAGIAVLAVCRQALIGKNKSMPKLDGQIQRGWGWMATHKTAVGDAKERWSYYFHYGLERAAILCDVERIQDVDWYRAGAEMLLRDQLGGGGWISESDGGGPQAPDERGKGKRGGRGGGIGRPTDTAFAILFLRRGFRKVPGAVTPARTPMLLSLTATASDEDIRNCAEGLAKRGKPAMQEVLTALRSDVAPRRRAAALALRAIAGEDFGIDPARDADGNAEALRKAELWHLKNR